MAAAKSSVDQKKRAKRSKQVRSEICFWVLLLGFLTVLTCSVMYAITTWKNPPVMIPIVDQIDMGRHNDRPGVSFFRGRNQLFRVGFDHDSPS